MLKNKKIICITGPAGSGKTTLANYLKNRGFHVINVDSLGHKALNMAKDQIVRAFGDVLDPDGSINREKLKKQLKTHADWEKLERITHPIIRNLLIEEISKSAHNRIVIDAAIPFKLEIANLCDLFVKITAPENVLIQRLKKRGINNNSFIKDILERQRNEFRQSRNWDIILENTGDLNKFLTTAYILIEQKLN